MICIMAQNINGSLLKQKKKKSKIYLKICYIQQMVSVNKVESVSSALYYCLISDLYDHRVLVIRQCFFWILNDFGYNTP